MMSAAPRNTDAPPRTKPCNAAITGLRFPVDRLKRIVVALVYGHDHVRVCTQFFNIHTGAKALALSTHDNDSDVVALAKCLDLNSDTRPLGAVKRIHWGLLKTSWAMPASTDDVNAIVNLLLIILFGHYRLRDATR